MEDALKDGLSEAFDPGRLDLERIEGQIRARSRIRARRRAVIVIATLACLAVAGGVLVSRLGGSTARLRATNGNHHSADAQDSPGWTHVPTDKSVFPGIAPVNDVVMWHGDLYAAGNSYGSGDSYAAEPVVWSSHDGVTWRKVWDYGSFATGSVASQRLVATSSRLLLVDIQNFHGAMWQSTDGKTFTSLAQPWGSDQLDDVAVVGDRVVVIEGGGAGGPLGVWVTSNATTWHRSTFDFGAASLATIGAVDGTFLIGGGDGPTSSGAPTVWHSTDGDHWTKDVITQQIGEVTAVAGDKQGLVAATSIGHQVAMWSSRGNEWREGSISDPGATAVGRILPVQGGFISVSGEQLLFSSGDGATASRTWQRVVAPPAGVQGIHAFVPFGSGLLVFAGTADGDEIWRVSPSRAPQDAVPATGWTQLSNDPSAFPPAAEISDVVFWRGDYYAAGDHLASGSSGPDPAVWSSHDGKEWKQVWAGDVSQTAATGQRLLATANSLLLFDARSLRGRMWASTDGHTWRARTQPWGDAFVVDAARRGQAYLAITIAGGGASAQVWVSSDGEAWKRSTFDFRGSPSTVTVANGVFVVGGSDDPYPSGVPAVWRSKDAQHWAKQVLTKEPGTVSTIAAANGVVVAATGSSNSNQMALWSSTGSTWVRSPTASPRPTGVGRILATASGFVALSDRGDELWYSPFGTGRPGATTWRPTAPVPAEVGTIDALFGLEDGSILVFARHDAAHGYTTWKWGVGPSGGAATTTTSSSETTPAPTTTAAPTTPLTLDPSDGPGPGASPCWSGDPTLPTITVGMIDNVPAPRCLVIQGDQRLQLRNASTVDTITATLGTHLNVTVPPGAAAVFPGPVGNYLAPGLHSIDGTSAVIWVDGPATLTR